MTSVVSIGDPEGESTRRHEDDLSLPSRRHRSTRFGPHSVNINTSALEREFPGWAKGADDDAESTLNHSDSDAGSTKENRDASRPRQPGRNRVFSAGGKPRTFSEMQPRVDNESTTSTGLSTAAKSHLPQKEMGRSVSVQLVAQRPHEPSQPFSQQTKNVTVDTSMNTMNRTMGSFFLPNLSHIQDFMSGTLRFSSMKNGMPIFVKNGKVHDKTQQGPNQHAELDNVEIPEDEQKIFVSMDMIREEIAALQDHHDMLQREAEQLQDEVHQLQLELERLRHKRADSGLGSESDHPSSPHINSQKTSKRLDIVSFCLGF